jgi:hypothetical protein
MTPVVVEVEVESFERRSLQHSVTPSLPGSRAVTLPMITTLIDDNEPDVADGATALK